MHIGEQGAVVICQGPNLDFFTIHGITSFHPEMALLGDLFVNLRDFLCDVLCVRLRTIP